MIFTVYGNPIPKARARVVNGHSYTPATTTRFEHLVAAAARAAGVREATDQPLRLEITFYRETRHRCDIDNLGKSILDGLNRIAWRDDNQVVDLILHKRICKENPRTEIHWEEA